MKKTVIIIMGEDTPLEIAKQLTMIAHYLRILAKEQPKEFEKNKIWDYGSLTVQTEPKKEGEDFFG